MNAQHAASQNRVTQAGCRPKALVHVTHRRVRNEYFSLRPRASGTCLPESHTSPMHASSTRHYRFATRQHDFGIWNGRQRWDHRMRLLGVRSWCELRVDDNTSNSMKGFGMALLIGFFLLPAAVVTIALADRPRRLGRCGDAGCRRHAHRWRGHSGRSMRGVADDVQISLRGH